MTGQSRRSLAGATMTFVAAERVKVPRPADVVDIRNDLHSFWVEHPELALLLCLEGKPPTGEHRTAAASMYAWTRTALTCGEMWWVNPDMSVVIEAAAPSMPDVEPAPASQWGIAVFARPVTGTDSVSGEPIRTCCYLWGPAVRDGMPVIGIATFGHIDDMDEAVVLRDLRAAGMYRPQLVYTGSSTWPIGAPTSTVDRDMSTASLAQSFFEDRRTLAAIWGLTRSPGVETVDGPVDRQVRRRAARTGLPVPPGGVRVVRLHASAAAARDRAAGQPGGAPDWSHRWLVGGHWRRQWYPSKQAHDAVYILPYVKGPAGKPLVVKEKVTAIVA